VASPGVGQNAEHGAYLYLVEVGLRACVVHIYYTRETASLDGRVVPKLVATSQRNRVVRRPRTPGSCLEGRWAALRALAGSAAMAVSPACSLRTTVARHSSRHISINAYDPCRKWKCQ
jgi:hypothetical protein